MRWWPQRCGVCHERKAIFGALDEYAPDSVYLCAEHGWARLTGPMSKLPGFRLFVLAGVDAADIASDDESEEVVLTPLTDDHRRE